VIIGVQLAAFVIVLFFLLRACVREPLRRMTLDHVRYATTSPVEMPLEILRVAAGRLDADEIDDLLLIGATPAGSTMMVFRGSESGLDFAAPIPRGEGMQAFDLVVGDLDGDGLDDVIGTNSARGTRSMAIWWNRGSLNFQRDTLPVGLRFAAILDVDMDGSPDLLGITGDLGEIRAFHFENGTLSQEPFIAEGVYDNSVRDLEAAHLDGSGADVALVSGDRIRLLRSGGLMPDFTSYFNLPPAQIAGQRLGRHQSTMVLEDLNGDGRADLAHIDAETVQVRLGLGGDDFIENRYPTPGQPADMLIAGDFDGNGVADLVTVSQDSRHIQVLSGEVQ
jgi:hypothetical protein